MKAVNDGVLLLELCALAAIAYWGWRAGSSTATRLVLAVGAVVLAPSFGASSARRATRSLKCRQRRGS
jgi:hypothetical protein